MCSECLLIQFGDAFLHKVKYCQCDCIRKHYLNPYSFLCEDCAHLHVAEVK